MTPSTDDANLLAFEARGRSDRHQFRFIVAPDDAVELDDLRSFTRALLTRMEADLGTALDWVAVDHWDTDNPHTHLVLRGRHQAGHDLVIAREYLTKGMRLRACEVATEWLGLRTELEVRQGLLREVAQERWTSLDQGLQARSADGVIDLAKYAGGPVEDSRSSLFIGRLQRLEKMGLARALGQARWQLRADAEPTLRALGERGDIVRTMQRAFAAQPREFTVFNPGTPVQAVVGRVAGKGIADELQDRGYAILDATDGRAYYVRLPAGFDLEELPQGAIVQARAAVDRAVDRHVVAFAQAGVYRADHHLAQLKGAPGAGIDPVAIVTGHVRRLEALRRAGHVERMAEGVWRVPNDLVERGRAYDRTRLSGGSVEVLSHRPLQRQIRAVGATWLDQQLIDDRLPTGRMGFASAVHEALAARKQFLVEQGVAQRQGQRIVVTRAMLDQLRERDLAAAAARVARETKLTYRPLHQDGRVSGVYRRSIPLASGRFAMLDDGVGFSLVPWRPVLEKRLGQTVTAIVHGDWVTWQFGRARSPGR
jgi:type IV secretory pathway VirD2 relaxase